MIRRHTHFTTTIDTPEGNTLDVELPVNLNDWENPEIITRFTPNHIIVGYLAHDDSPQNPLDDCDGMGKIHHHPRSRYGRRDSDYFEALGLDSYGDPVIDEDKMQMLWRDKVLALPDEVFTPYKPDDETIDPEHFAQDLRLQLANEYAGDYSLWDMVYSAFYRNVRNGDWELDRDQIASLAEALEDYICWNWDEVRQECWIGADPDAVLLDLYDHSGVTWSVSGSGKG